jgi:hypothetical protein
MEVPLNECRNSYQLNHLLRAEFRRDFWSTILLRFRVLSSGALPKFREHVTRFHTRRGPECP